MIVDSTTATPYLTRPIDWGTFWYIGRWVDGKWHTGSPGDQANHLRRAVEVVLAGSGPHEEARQHRLADVLGIE